MGILDAWAYGLPVLMTAECNIPEGFTAGAGLRVEPKAESIAQGLAQLFEMSDGERQTMGARGLSLVKERFAWPMVAAQMRAVYEWLLGDSPAPDCVRLD